MKRVTIDPRYHDAVIFDLDGFVADIAALHAAAWKKTLDHYLTRRPANESEDHSPFAEDDYRRRVDGKPPLDGLADFLASRGISLPRGKKADTSEETVCGLGNREQDLFLGLLEDAVPGLESTVDLVRELQEAGVATAIYSSSHDCRRVLRAAGIEDLFAAPLDGVLAGVIGLPGKPDPAVLFEAARRLARESEPVRARRGRRGWGGGGPQIRLRGRDRCKPHR